MSGNTKVTYFVLSGILILAAVLRLIHPFSIPFTGDEFNALYRTHFNSFSELIAKGVIVDAHPAGVQVFLYYWTKAFGYSEIVVKLPFIICGILSVLYIFLIGRDWFNPTVGLICAAYLATLQYTVMYSQIARPYASGLFFSLAMVYYWNKMVFQPHERPYKNGALYILFSALCAYNHYFSLLFAALVGFTLLFFIQKKYVWRYIAAGIIIFLLFTPHFRIFLYQLHIGGLDEQLAKPTHNFIFDYIQYVFHFSFYVYASVVILFFAGFIITLKNRVVKANYLIISFCWFVIPFIIGFLYSKYVSAVLQFSVLIFSFPFLLLFLFGWIPEVGNKLKVAIVSLVCLITTTSLIVERNHYSVFYRSRYEQIISLSDSVCRNMGRDSCLCFIQGTAEMPESHYVKKDKADTSSFIYIYQSPDKKELIQYLENHKRKYLSYGALAGSDPDYVSIFLSYYPYIVRQSNCYGGTFYLFSSLPNKGKSPCIFESLNDFEHSAHFWSEGNTSFICDSVFLSAKHSYKMDSLHEWGPTFTCPLDSMISNKNNFINVSLQLFPLGSLDDVMIVSSLESGDKGIDWRATPVSNFISSDKYREWVMAYHSIKLSDLNLHYPSIIAKIYIWNKGKRNFYMDNFDVKTIKGNPIIYGLFEKLY